MPKFDSKMHVDRVKTNGFKFKEEEMDISIG